MKFISKNNGVIIILLTILIIFSGFMIIRLEIKAASLQSRIDEHHSQLQNNSDALDQVNLFMRKVGNNFIYIDKDMFQLGTGKSTLQFKGDLFNVNIRSGKLVLELSEPDKLVQLINESSKIKLKDDKINIEAKGDISIGPSTDKIVGYNKEQDIIYMQNGDSYVLLGELKSDKTGKSTGTGVMLASKTDGPNIGVQNDKISLSVPTKDGKYIILIDPTKELVGMQQGHSSIKIKNDSVLIRAKQDISIGPSADKIVGYNKEQDIIYMQNGDSYVLLGELKSDKTGKSTGTGVMLASKTDGPNIGVQNDKISLSVPTKDGQYIILIDPTKELVGIQQGHSSIKIKKDNIEIKALGDINITSKNGKVNINGKN